MDENQLNLLVDRVKQLEINELFHQAQFDSQEYETKKANEKIIELSARF